jgi:hypothetical protein
VAGQLAIATNRHATRLKAWGRPPTSTGTAAGLGGGDRHHGGAGDRRDGFGGGAARAARPRPDHSAGVYAGRRRAGVAVLASRACTRKPRLASELVPCPLSGLSQLGAPRARPARSGLRCPIYNCVYKGLSLTDRIQSGGANADRNRFAISYCPLPTVRKAHFDDGETDVAMFHGGPPLTFNYVLIGATASVSAGPP